MKAILLAAGRGTRISKDIGETCKCLMDIGGTSLIKNTVKMLVKNDIDVHIVLGYRRETIIEELRGLPVTYYYNPFYSVTNSIASLWFARDALCGSGVIIGNADVFWEQGLLDLITGNRQENFLVADSSRTDLVKGDYFFMHRDGKLLDHGKGMEQGKITAEYVGLGKISAPFMEKFKSRLEALIDEQKANMWWEDVLYSYIGEEDIYVMDINGLFWREIDYIDDYYKILEYRKAMK